MPENLHHEHLIRELSEQLMPVFENSPQGIYLYLDDIHKSCNKQFAAMLGYNSPEEWVKNKYPLDDIVEEDQEKGVKAYTDASEQFIASEITGRWITQDGKELNTNIILVPISYQNEVFVLHFVTQV